MSAAKTKLRYVGPFPSVDVEDHTGSIHVVEQGGEKSFPPEVADSLLEQEGNWVRASASQPSISAKARELAEANGIDLTTVKGTGAGGNVKVSDVEAAIAAEESASDTPAEGEESEEDNS